MTGSTVDRTHLRRQWTVAALTFGLTLVVVIGAVSVFLPYQIAAMRALPALGVAGFELWFLRRHLGTNHPEGDEETLYPTWAYLMG